MFSENCEGVASCDPSLLPHSRPALAFERRNHLGRGLCSPHVPQATTGTRHATHVKSRNHRHISGLRRTFGLIPLVLFSLPTSQTVIYKYTLPLLLPSSLYLRPCPRTIHFVSSRAAAAPLQNSSFQLRIWQAGISTVLHGISRIPLFQLQVCIIVCDLIKFSLFPSFLCESRSSETESTTQRFGNYTQVKRACRRSNFVFVD